MSKTAPSSAEIADTLLCELPARPTPQVMGDLVLRGMTDANILDAGIDVGYPHPHMPKTLRELEVILPYLGKLSDTLHQKRKPGIFALLGRDLGPLFDIHALWHPEDNPRYLPASVHLVHAMYDSPLAGPFLSQYGMTKDYMDRPDSRITLADTGYEGSLKRLLAQALAKAHSMEQHDAEAKIDLQLIATAKQSAGSVIMNLAEAGLDSTKLERADRQLKKGIVNPISHDETSLSMVLTIENLPQYYGCYTVLQEVGGRILAVPDKNATVVEDIDRLTDDSLDTPSVVNPVAAAIVQRRVVKWALENGPDNFIYRSTDGAGQYSVPQPR